MKNLTVYINKILKYWYNDNLRYFNEDKWFKNGNKLDKEISEKFSKILLLAEKGKLEYWNETKDGFLAHTLLLDQFSRHIYRNTPKAYGNDKLCITITDKYILCYINQLKPLESLFALMPYQHSENLCKQNTGIFLIKYLLAKEKTKYGIKLYKKILHHQKEHAKLIEKFRRFPKRNKILNIKSTKKELQYILNSNSNLPY